MTQFLTPEGPISRGYWKLAALIASCPEWWFRICAAASPTEAMRRVHWPTASDTATNPGTGETETPTDARPRAIIDDSPVFDLSGDGMGSVLLESALQLSFEIPAFEDYEYWPEQYWPADYWPADYWPESTVDVRDQKTAFTNAIGRLIQQMWQRRGSNPGPDDPVDPLNTSHLEIVRITQQESPGLVDPSDFGGAYFGAVVFLVYWRGVM